VLVSWGNQLSVSLLGYLFGNIVTVGTIDVWATVVAGCFVLVLVGMLYSELVQSTFDADLAQVSGVPVGRTNMLLALLTGVMVTLSMRVVGGLMVGALVVFPVLAALQLHQGFRVTLLVASFMGVVSVFAGLVVSFYQDVAASGAIVLTALLILVVVTVLRTMWTFKVSQSTYVRPSKLR
jgi:zinc transport system permease protein